MSAATVVVHVEDLDISGIIEDDDGWGFSTPEVTVTFSNEAWWCFIEAMQEWLGECPHCDKKIGARPTPEADPPQNLAREGEGASGSEVRATTNLPESPNP